MTELITALLAAVFGFVIPTIKDILMQTAVTKRLTRSSTGKMLLQIFGISSGFNTLPVPRQEDLFAALSHTSAQMDRILREINAFMTERQAGVAKIETDLHKLSQQESELKKRVEGLQQVPLPAAEYFAKVLEERERKSSVRDYLLFLAGVVASAIIAVALKKFGYG